MVALAEHDVALADVHHLDHALDERELRGCEPAEQLLDAEVLRERLGRAPSRSRMRSSHHSSAASTSGNEWDAMSSRIPTGASAMISTQPTSFSAVRQVRQHRDRRAVEVSDALAVEDHRVDPGDVVDHRSEQALGRAEEQVALELEHRHRVGVLREQGVLVGGAHAVGARLAAVVAAAHDGADLGLETQRVQVEVDRHALTHLDAAHAVPAGVEPRREDADAELTGQHGDDTAGDAALRRQPHGVDPLARVVVHAARAHHAEHVLDVAGVEGALAGDRVHARRWRASPPWSRGRGT